MKSLDRLKAAPIGTVFHLKDEYPRGTFGCSQFVTYGQGFIRCAPLLQVPRDAWPGLDSVFPWDKYNAPPDELRDIHLPRKSCQLLKDEYAAQ